MADNSILPKAGAPLVDQTGRPTRAFYSFFNALVSNLQGQINTISKLVKNLALVIAALGGDPDSGEGIPDIAGQIDAKADKSTTITGLGSIQGGGDLSQDRFIALDGDVDTVPGVSFYGSPDGSTKGWAAFSGNFAPSMDADDNVTLDLADLADSGTGAALVKITRDSKGRISGTSAATTTDLTEGSNLYFTNERADARITIAKADPDGIASLVGGKLDPGQLPALAITETFVVNTQAAMLALDCQQGDVAVRTDLSKSFILTVAPPSTLTNWQELLTPTGGVSSFNGRTGSVTPASGDYTFSQIASTPTTLSGYGITDAVPSSRTVNGKALSANITLSASDVGAESAITAGTTSQYWRGDKTWRDFATDVRATTLTGLSTATATAVTAADNVLVGIGKLQAQATANAWSVSGKEPTIAGGTTAQFWRGDKFFSNVLLGPMGTLAGNSTAGTSAVCYEIGTDVVGRGAAIKSLRGITSGYTGMVLCTHDGSGLNDVLTLKDDKSAEFTSTLFIDTVNSRVGIGAAPVSSQLEVTGPTGGLYLNRTSGAEPFIVIRANDDAKGAQIRGSSTGYGLRFTTLATGQPTMLAVSPTSVNPGFDNASSSGTGSLRWSVVYAATGSINTSDAREKTPVTSFTTAEIAAASALAQEIGTYQWLASVEEKGDAARRHAGMTVQRAIEVMESHGLDPMRYGFICHDKWDELPEQWADVPEERDAAGNVVREAGRELMQEYRPAGDRYSFRTDELMLFMARGFAARLDALEAK